MTNRQVVDFSQAHKRFIGFSDGPKCLLEMLCYPLGRCWRPLYTWFSQKLLEEAFIPGYDNSLPP